MKLRRQYCEIRDRINRQRTLQKACAGGKDSRFIVDLCAGRAPR